MKKGKLNFVKSYLYRYRHWISYGLICIGLFIALIFAGIYLPGGISNNEIQSVIKSNSISINSPTLSLINLPYHVLQKLCFQLFGVSIISIKLPSIILAFFSIVGLIILLRQWFKPNIALLASLLAFATSKFLFITQNGTPDILYLFWPIWLVLFTSLIPIQKKLRILTVLAFFIVASLSIYTPICVYVLLVMVIAILFHPHLRYIIKQLTKTELILGFSVTLLISAPLLLSLIKSPAAGLTLLGVPDSWPNIYNNLTLIGNQFFGFYSSTNRMSAPFFGLGSSLLILFGIYSTFKIRQTSKSYILILWLICLIPILILNPNYIYITFLPLTILLASGLNGLLLHWYELFPRNPYARVGGLIPVVVLVSALILTGVSRYIYGFRYDPIIMSSYSKDLNLIPKDTKKLLVAKNEFDFYKIVEKYNKTYEIIEQPMGDSFVVTRIAKRPFSGYDIKKIITSANKNDANRFYLYKKIGN